MKKQTFFFIFRIFLLTVSVFILTGCGNRNLNPSSDSETSEKSDTDFIFPEALPFLDDTGKLMQRDGNCLYSFHRGKLLRFDTDTEETVVLYQTASIHRVNFCLHENDIYFVERSSCDSPDGRDTALWRIGKDGSHLTLLAESIVNAEMFRDGGEYSIDICDNMIYLLHNTSIEENDVYVTKTANLYYRLEKDGSVSEAEEAETLYGALPQRFSPVLTSDFPSLPYAMRNYGYVFVQDSEQMLYRLKPESGREECLDIHADEVSSFSFSGALIFLHSQYSGIHDLYNLTDKTTVTIDSSLWESLSCLSVFPSEYGFYFCGSLQEDEQSSGEYTSRFVILKISPQGSAESLFFDDPLSFGAGFQEYAIRADSCLLNDHLYYYDDDDEMLQHLMRIPLLKDPDFQILESWPSYPASSPAVLTVEVSNEDIPIDEKVSLNRSLRKLFLEEETEADRLINAALTKVYTNFEQDAQNMTDEVQDTLDWDPAYYEGFDYPAVFDLSLSVSCSYMDDDAISFCCNYYQYYAYAAHGYYWSDYYVFDRTSGKRLTSRDFVDNTAFFETSLPYLQKASNAEYDVEILSDPSRFSLSEDGYTLYFAPYEIGSYAEGEYLITIPYEAFEDNL